MVEDFQTRGLYWGDYRIYFGRDGSVSARPHKVGSIPAGSAAVRKSSHLWADPNVEPRSLGPKSFADGSRNKERAGKQTPVPPARNLNLKPLGVTLPGGCFRQRKQLTILLNHDTSLNTHTHIFMHAYIYIHIQTSR